MLKINVIGIILLILGLVIFLTTVVAIGFEFGKIANIKEETVEINNDFEDLLFDLKSVDVTIKSSDNDKCQILTRIKNNDKILCKVENGTLIIKEERENWIGVHYGSVTVFLPKSNYKQMKVDGSTTDISIEKINFDDVKINASTGDVNINSNIGNLEIELSTGDVVINELNGTTLKATTSTGDVTINDSKLSENATFEFTTGDIKIENVNIGGKLTIKGSTCDWIGINAKANSVSAETSTGDMQLKNVIITKEMKLKTSSGDINFDECDAETMNIETLSGDVEGTLKTSKIFYVSSSSGDVYVPKSTNGGLCEVSTKSGDITLNISTGE